MITTLGKIIKGGNDENKPREQFRDLLVSFDGAPIPDLLEFTNKISTEHLVPMCIWLPQSSKPLKKNVDY